jgi:hypothetical protein
MEPEPRRGAPDLERRAHEARSHLFTGAIGLSNAELLRRVLVLATAEREATVELVAHLAELDARRLYLGEGYGSLFAYCTGVLRLAEHAALNRIHAARASREFPVILALLADGSLNLSTLRLIAPHLRADNFDSVVTMARGRSKREVELLVAGLVPRPDLASSVRRLPTPTLHAATAAANMSSTPEQRAAPERPTTSEQLIEQRSVEESAAEPSTRDGRNRAVATPALLTPNTQRPTRFGSVSGPEAAEPARTTPRPVVGPLAPGRYRVQFTVGEETHEKLRRAQQLLRREIPDGDPGAIFDRALTLLLVDVARKKLAQSQNPRDRVAQS